MAEPIITCGCGRTMNPEYRRGRGAYRCGCGVRIQIAEQAAPTDQCWYDGCRTVSTAMPPLKLCDDHQKDAALVLSHLTAKRALWLEAAVSGRYPAAKPTPSPQERNSVVYFMRRETLIKIGYSSNLKVRAASLNATILATTPGGPVLEAQLHNRFEAHRRHGEWFDPAPEILDLVNSLRAKEGRPPVSV